MSIESRRQRREDLKKFKNFVPRTPEELQYHKALKKVKRIKGFYTHLVVFIILNTFFVVSRLLNPDPNEKVTEVLVVTFSWGIGLLAHGLSVFLPEMILGQKWEERKIQVLMDKEKQNKWE